MYYLFVVVLEGCPYSNAALELLTDNKTNFKSLKVTSNDKEKYKTNEISTFPQIYLKKNNNSLLLGGYSDLKTFFETFNNQPYNIKNVNEFKRKYSNWNKHSILRMIELINLKRLG
jgi:glutaredoxin